MTEVETPESLRRKIEEGILYLEVTGKKSVSLKTSKKEKEWLKRMELR
jgi:hypothetical protein